MANSSNQNERERIKNLGDPQGFTFFPEPTDPEKRNLGDPDDVAAIVREFCIGVYDLRSKVTLEQLSGPDALAQLEALANRYAGIFYGKEPGSFRAIPFNSPTVLGDFIVTRMGLEEPPERAGYIMFMNTANQILEAYEGHQTGELDDDTVKWRIDAAIEDASGILLGLPPED